MMDVGEILKLGLQCLKENHMNHDIQIENPEEITHSLLHDLKNMVVDIQNLKLKTQILEEEAHIFRLENINLRDLMEDLYDEQSDRIKIPHRCPLCNGDTFSKDGDLCFPCNGKGIVWG